jgi:heptosyltransferase-2
MRLGVFLPNWIGDVVMATPALRALRKLAGPDGHVVGVMRPYVAEVLAGTQWLDEWVFYRKRATTRELSGPSVAAKLRAAELDAIVLFPNSLRTAWIAWRSGVREIVGYADALRGWLLTTKLYNARRGWGIAPLPAIDSYLNLAYTLGCNWEPPQLELATTDADKRQVDAIWDKLKLPAGDRVVVMNSGGAFGAAKDWPAESFAALARRTACDWGYSVLINCGPSERAVAAEIAARAGDSRVVSLADEPKLPIGLSKEVIRRARLLVTTDSGPRFFGVAFGKPVVSLFGPTNPRTTRTHYERETCLSLALDCQPCMEPTCPLVHHHCMRNLSVDWVYQAIAKQLTTPSLHDNAA